MNWRNIIIHCSDSNFGDAAEIRRWHMEPPRNWADCGYHFVILNGVRKSKQPFNEIDNGKIETGRPIDQAGAHCAGMNHNSIGICLIGKEEFEPAQFEAAAILINDLMQQFPTIDTVLGHYQTETGAAQGKTCPNFDVDQYKLDYDIKG